MTYYVRIVVLFLCMLFGEASTAQWKDMFSYNVVENVSFSRDYYVSQCRCGILLVDVASLEIFKFSKVNGLSSANVVSVSARQDEVVVAHRDGNIDIIRNLEVSNLDAIFKTNHNLENQLNAISLKNNKILAGADGGIFCVDIANDAVDWFCYTNSPILCTAWCGEKVVVSDGNSVWQCTASNIAVQDFSFWSKVYSFDNGVVVELVENDGEVFANVFDQKNNVSFVYNVSNNQTIFTCSGNIRLTAINGLFTVVSLSEIFVIDSHGDVKTNFSNQNNVRVGLAISLSDILLGSLETGLILLKNGEKKSIKVNSPQKNDISAVVASKKTFAIVESERKYISVYSNGFWNRLENNNNVEYQDILINPYNQNHVFATSNVGLYEFLNSGLKAIYNSENSLVGLSLLKTLATTTDGYLHVADSSDVPIKIFSPDGSWYQLEESKKIANRIVKQILIYNDRYIFVVFNNSSDIFVVDNNNTPIIFSDDKSVLFSLSTSEGWQATRVNKLCVDNRNYVWAGTDGGCAYCVNVELFFSGGGIFYRPVIPDEELPEFSHYLLKKHEVLDMVCDVSGKIWVSTANSGIFVLSDDEYQQVEHYTSENSPLPSDNVVGLALADDGNMLINTNLGLIMLKTGVQKPTESFSDLKVYPNPYVRGKSESIVVENLELNTEIYITTVSGRIVSRAKSQSGSVKLKLPENIAIGVYLVVLQNADTGDKKVVKLSVK